MPSTDDSACRLSCGVPSGPLSLTRSSFAQRSHRFGDCINSFRRRTRSSKQQRASAERRRQIEDLRERVGRRGLTARLKRLNSLSHISDPETIRKEYRTYEAGTRQRLSVDVVVTLERGYGIARGSIATQRPWR